MNESDRHKSSPEITDEGREFDVEIIISALTGHSLGRSHVGDEIATLKEYMTGQHNAEDEDSLTAALAMMNQAILAQYPHLANLNVPDSIHNMPSWIEVVKSQIGETLHIAPLTPESLAVLGLRRRIHQA